ncbi:ABC transporter substrate-binding protein [Paenibacillus sp. MSJ-34]|uniref:ABC transporter substrate-binding protein n=1 Tax=Paenibacillus sp. MSJ-34 TaxID=2841529 RepID=UPI001C0FBE69|nr:ABC transporter substrate-binding protein [Paenibacillus sp. MSJ-34]MBU5444835.1 ABC transporter substrate-binding protein [Paenibacillus sp. MSJ-34]
MKKVFLILCIATMMLTGCHNQSPKIQTPTKIKILAWDEQGFYDRYGNIFLAAHPHIELEVVSVLDSAKPGEDFGKTIEKIVKEQKPDVLTLSMDFYTIYRERNELSPLSAFMKEDDFDLSGFTPAIINYIKDELGELYGLTPSFTGKALYYNKKLFHTYGVPQPADTMTWDDVFALAQRFLKSMDNEAPLFGFYDRDLSNPFVMALKIGEGGGLSLYNNNEIMLNTKGWNTIFQSVIDCLIAETCWDYNKQQATDSAVLKRHPFLKGNIAMAIDDSDLYKMMTLNKNDYKDLDWGVVSFPVRAEQPDTGNGMHMEEIFSIHSTSTQKNAAWEFIKYVCGEDYAKLLPKTNPYALPARKPADDPTIPDIQAFYKLDHVTNTMMNTLRRLPKPVITKMDEVSVTYINDVFEGKLTVSEALQLIEDDLQVELNEKK